MTKDELRKQLQEQIDKHLQLNPEAVTRYAAAPKPDRMPWKKKPSVMDQAYADSLAEIQNTANTTD
ncbi:hypothetical protein [Pseudomonas viridiflava]|uniref:hypothetical protein n=1 Tax=Pseudomonas viridiflava TaxID=33069 RepID=UPI000F042299|nr:hypothetical protein [Pseudomonas viridiflava]